MNSLLSDDFRKIVAKDKDLRMSVEAKPDIGYSTGFPTYDAITTYPVYINNENKNLNLKYYCSGITDGTLNGVIGKTGTGKSSFALQVGANIIRPFKTSVMFEDSIEGGVTQSRREVLTGFYGDEYINRIIVRNQGITAENFYKRIKTIHDLKINNKDKYLYDTGLLDYYAKPVIAFEPTVYILDSVALLYPDDMLDDDDLKGASSMAVSKSVAVVSQLVSAIIPMLKAANIIVFAINHIKDDIQIGPFTKAPDVKYLKPGERLPKGKAVTYLSSNIIRLDNSTKLKPNETFHIDGSIVNISNVKTRASAANRSVPMIFNQYTGFDPVLSIFQMLKQNNRVNGSGIGLYLDDYKDYKFSMGNLIEKLENPDFYEIFSKVASDEIKRNIIDPKEYQHTNVNNKMAMDIMNSIK